MDELQLAGVASGLELRLQFAARNAGLTPNQLAASFDVEVNDVQNWFNGMVQPNAEQLIDMVRLFDVSATWLMRGIAAPDAQLGIDRLKGRTDFVTLPKAAQDVLVALMSTL